MNEQRNDSEPANNRFPFWLIAGFAVSKIILQSILENWLSKPMSKSIALFVVCTTVPVYWIIRRKQSRFKRISNRAMAAIWILISLLLSIAMYYPSDTPYPSWVTFVVFGVLIFLLVVAKLVEKREARKKVISFE
jgi:hypothetical protein